MDPVRVSKVFPYPFSAVGAPWDSLSVPINTKPLHPGYIVSAIVCRPLRADADDEREKLASDTISIGNSPLLFLS
jgi:hypothetical protein